MKLTARSYGVIGGPDGPTVRFTAAPEAKNSP